MSVRKRTWNSPSGEPKEAWVVDYVDQQGDRHLKTFAKKRDADAHHALVGVTVRAGTAHRRQQERHRRQREAMSGLESCEAAGFERTSLVAYRQRADLHIVADPWGAAALAIDGPRWCGASRIAGPGRALARHGARCAGGALGGILADAQERGLVGTERGLLAAQEPSLAPRRERQRQAQDRRRVCRLTRRDPRDRRCARHRGRALRPLLLTGIFTGLRASELRGLRWSDVDLKRGELHVRQRADRYGKIGRPKSEAGERTVPLPPMVIAALREHYLACPKRSSASPFPEQPRQHRSPQQHRRARPASGPGRRRCRRSARAREIQGPAPPPPLLRLMVHQPARRWRARAPAQGGAGPARARVDPDDGGYLWPSVSARRRRRRTGGGREGLSGLKARRSVKIKGGKWHILVDTLGLLLNVVVHPADVQDRDGAFQLLRRARRLFPFIKRIFADGGYAGKKMACVWRTGAWKIQIVKRSDAAGFEVLPKRWIVERTFAWISRNRRLARDFERYTTTVAAFVRLAMIRIMLRRLLQTPRHEFKLPGWALNGADTAGQS